MFNSLITKIKDADFTREPYRHIFIQDFIEPIYFDSIIYSDEILLSRSNNTEELAGLIQEKGWEPIQFPGTTTNLEEYILWENGLQEDSNVDTCEGFGMVFRLKRPKTQILSDIQEFLQSDQFIEVLCDKFGLDNSNVYADTGIQKYLNGYEISPHPDVRSKALTFMVNINSSEKSETLDYHTKYMTFKSKYKYVQEFWKYNDRYDRCWVPWSWCETAFEQAVNNSIVIFSPSDNTLHAVKASYDHLETQRTQLYGNLWYSNMSSTGYIKRSDSAEKLAQLPWQAYVIDDSKGTSMTYKMPAPSTQKPISRRTNRFKRLREYLGYWNR
jgi:hypothetical protein